MTESQEFYEPRLICEQCRNDFTCSKNMYPIQSQSCSHTICSFCHDVHKCGRPGQTDSDDSYHFDCPICNAKGAFHTTVRRPNQLAISAMAVLHSREEFWRSVVSSWEKHATSLEEQLEKMQGQGKPEISSKEYMCTTVDSAKKPPPPSQDAKRLPSSHSGDDLRKTPALEGRRSKLLHPTFIGYSTAMKLRSQQLASHAEASSMAQQQHHRPGALTSPIQQQPTTRSGATTTRTQQQPQHSAASTQMPLETTPHVNNAAQKHVNPPESSSQMQQNGAHPTAPARAQKKTPHLKAPSKVELVERDTIANLSSLYDSKTDLPIHMREKRGDKTVPTKLLFTTFDPLPTHVGYEMPKFFQEPPKLPPSSDVGNSTKHLVHRKRPPVKLPATTTMDHVHEGTKKLAVKPIAPRRPNPEELNSDDGDKTQKTKPSASIPVGSTETRQELCRKLEATIPSNVQQQSTATAKKTERASSSSVDATATRAVQSAENDRKPAACASKSAKGKARVTRRSNPPRGDSDYRKHRVVWAFDKHSFHKAYQLTPSYEGYKVDIQWLSSKETATTTIDRIAILSTSEKELHEMRIAIVTKTGRWDPKFNVIRELLTSACMGPRPKVSPQPLKRQSETVTSDATESPRKRQKTSASNINVTSTAAVSTQDENSSEVSSSSAASSPTRRTSTRRTHTEVASTVAASQKKNGDFKEVPSTMSTGSSTGRVADKAALDVTRSHQMNGRSKESQANTGSSSSTTKTPPKQAQGSSEPEAIVTVSTLRNGKLKEATTRGSPSRTTPPSQIISKARLEPAAASTLRNGKVKEAPVAASNSTKMTGSSQTADKTSSNAATTSLERRGNLKEASLPTGTSPRSVAEATPLSPPQIKTLTESSPSIPTTVVSTRSTKDKAVTLLPKKDGTAAKEASFTTTSATGSTNTSSGSPTDRAWSQRKKKKRPVSRRTRIKFADKFKGIRR